MGLWQKMTDMVTGEGAAASVTPELVAANSALLKDLVEMMAKALVDNPDKVDVTEVDGNSTVVLELRVAKEDLGKIIGKQGRTARSMRTILSAASTKARRRAVLEIIE